MTDEVKGTEPEKIWAAHKVEVYMQSDMKPLARIEYDPAAEYWAITLTSGEAEVDFDELESLVNYIKKLPTPVEP